MNRPMTMTWLITVTTADDCDLHNYDLADDFDLAYVYDLAESYETQ
jgi:hypothetical protein